MTVKLKNFESDDEWQMVKTNKKKYIHKEHLSGRWKQEQDEIYIKFILENREKLISKSLRRSQQVFKELSTKLNNQRTPSQCRMHHQRMKKSQCGRSINSIVKFLKKKYKLLNRQKQLCVKQLNQNSNNSKIEQSEIGNGNNGGVQIKINTIIQFNINVVVPLDMIGSW